MPREERDARIAKALKKDRKFGTFLGVFTPSLLTILGLMMYLRFGWVLANAGLPLTILIVLMASAIAFITCLSASAIATNMRVGAGGVYYMVSRSLGPEFGGTIGIPLFICQTLSLTLYAFGLAESTSFLWPAEWGAFPLKQAAAVIILFTTIIAGRSASVSLRLQIPIMIAVGLSLLALFGGAFSGELATPEMQPHYDRSAPEGFWYIFAVFFPAITGFTVGINMSGDLEDPARSIPRGSILAVIVGSGIYLLIPLALSFAAEVSPAEMAIINPEDLPLWSRIAWGDFWFIYPGMWGAIISSAFGSALGAPRVLQALAADGLAPGCLAKMSKSGEPALATWVTGAIALLGVSLGDLNAVGVWVTIFFLTLYATTNLTSTIEFLVADPSFRPTIKIKWWLSLLGAIACVAVMFLINPLACVVAIFFEALLYFYLGRRSLKANWGDVRAGLWVFLCQYGLRQLINRPLHVRNWRPHILLFVSDVIVSPALLQAADWLNQRKGVLSVGHMVRGTLEEDHSNIRLMTESLIKRLQEANVAAFGKVYIVDNIENGIVDIAQASGVAHLLSNTVMLGWPRREELGNRIDKLERLIRVSHSLSTLGKSVVIAHFDSPEGAEKFEQIDVWCRSRHFNGDLMLLLAHRLQQAPLWRRAKITIRAVVMNEEEKERMLKKLTDLVEDVRIPAEIDVIVRQEGLKVSEMMHAASHDADAVFLGLAETKPGMAHSHAESLNSLVCGFKAAFVVRNGKMFDETLI